MALANSRRVRHLLRFKSSTCIRPQKRLHSGWSPVYPIYRLSTRKLIAFRTVEGFVIGTGFSPAAYSRPLVRGRRIESSEEGLERHTPSA